MPRCPTVMGEPVGADLRFWDSFFRTLLALLLLAPGPGLEGNQERLMISVRLSFCLSSYAGDGEREGGGGGPEPPSARAAPISPHPAPLAPWPPRTV